MMTVEKLTKKELLEVALIRNRILYRHNCSLADALEGDYFTARSTLVKLRLEIERLEKEFKDYSE